MERITEDLVAVFQGLTGASNTKLFGITPDGGVIELFEPSSIISGGDQRLGSMGLTGQSLRVVDDDLYFQTFVTIYGASTGNFAQGFLTDINRLNGDGTFELLHSFSNAGSVSNPPSITTEFDGAYVTAIGVNSGQLGVSPSDIWRIEPEGGATELSALTRYGAFVTGDMDVLGDTLFYAADERSPFNTGFNRDVELWRRGPDGTNDFVYVPPAGHSVYDVVTFGERVFFSVAADSNYSPSSLYTITEAGDPQEIDLSALEDTQWGFFPNLDRAGDRLFFYDTYDTLLELNTDGTFETLLRRTSGGTRDVQNVWDVEIWNGAAHALVTPLGGSSNALWRFDETGAYSDVTPDGLVDIEREMRVVGDTLYFEADVLVDDGFGGEEVEPDALFSLTPDGTLTQLTGREGLVPAIRGVGPVVAFDLAPPPGPTPEDDDLSGSEGAQTIDLLAGNDRYAAFGGNDTVLGNAGRDRIDGGEGDDSLEGQDGNDLLIDGPGNDTVRGGAGNDTIRNEGGSDLFDGGAGRDLLVTDVTEIPSEGFVLLADLKEGRHGRRDSDIGQDQLVAIEDFRTIGSWNAEIVGSDAANLLVADAGSDTLSGNGGNDTIHGGAGNDTLNGGAGQDLMIGGQGSDYYVVDDARDRVIENHGWEGRDTVVSSVDFLTGRAQVEEIVLTGTARIAVGNPLDQRIEGNAVDNVLNGERGNDTLIGGEGNDRYLVRAPGDNVVERAGEGTDAVFATRSYKLDAHVENLFLLPVRRPDGSGVDGVNGIGNAADNVIVGNPFNNLIGGREGEDTLRGDGGADRFLFDRAPGRGNVDRVVDFDATEGDRLLFAQNAFGGIRKGGLAEALFREGNRALDSNDRFLWEEGTGRLFFDGNGDAAGGQRLVAIFDSGTSLEASDIFLV